MSSDTTIVAPSLSTGQDESMFTFSKVEAHENPNKRSHLGPVLGKSDKSDENLIKQIRDYYSLGQLTKFLNSRDLQGELKFKRITLQFPDSLVCDSAYIVQILQDDLKRLNEAFESNKAKIDYTPLDFNKSEFDGDEVDYTDKPGSCASGKSKDIETLKPCSGKCGSQCKNLGSNGTKITEQRQQVWILADTSYSPCCIDEVAAEHVSADIVVHFGDACLNPVDKLPAVYVFGKPYLNHDTLITKFKETYTEKETKIMLMADAPYSHHLRELYTLLRSEYTNLAYADVDFSHCGESATVIDSYQALEEAQTIKMSSRVLYGLPKEEIQYLDEEDYDPFTQEYSLFHISKPADPRLLELSTKFGELTVFDPMNNEVNQGPFASMMRRYRFMHVARNAGTIGILVNTLSLSNTKKLLNKVVKWVRQAGKKHYMFVVGKPNVAKLANFENVEVWCVLGCGQSGIIIDSFGDYYRPIITPYELQMALNYQVTWSGKWITDFEEVMNQEGYKDEEEQEDDITDSTPSEKVNESELEDSYDEYAPQFNPVTGQLSASQPLRQLKHLEIEVNSMRAIRDSKDQPEDEQKGDGQLVKKFSTSLSIKDTVSTSAAYLQSRQWTGLGSDYREQEMSGEDMNINFKEGAEIEDGISGIARGYATDRDIGAL
ncbi:hypothetical protein CANARDRAFT_28875 [[Candida] arabinofermentans NRRL YB-2248]|uniref:2-(3-amino-3-carboxypropyl)histidine synthase subunit 2 n=1 Tax=[Candida] arabinofermentans NRRL YB-2248 TaxID=983967 RepID=A0A1E4SZ26_9ASCO|nr:hypothetical protein CANARDRAFT_28875 [[Candida] arabinofermentans NRRL YB-2248]